MENWEEHREDTRYVPITRQELLDDKKNAYDLWTMLSEEITKEQAAIICRYLFDKDPDFCAAGSYLEEILWPSMKKWMDRKSEEHRINNSTENWD